MRVVSLIPSATEMVHALGAGAWQVGRTHECDWPPSAGRIPAVTVHSTHVGDLSEIDAAVRVGVRDTHTIYELDMDALSLAKPDLVVTQSTCEVCAVPATVAADAACSLGAQVISLDPTTLDEVIGTATVLGERLGLARAGRGLSAHLHNRVASVRALVDGRTRPNVAVVEWANPLYTGGHWVPDMITAAGGIPVFGEHGQPSVMADVTDLTNARPDVVMLCGFDLGETLRRYDEVSTQPGWAEATAGARIIAVDGSAYFSRPGPRIVDGIELLAWVLHRPHPSLRPLPGRYVAVG